MYKQIRSILFKMNPEKVHNKAIMWGRFLAFNKLSKILRLIFVIKDDKLKTKILGIKLENPVGLAAGFDKNAQLTDFLPDLGFGFMEIGSVTAEPCEGNPKPRLHRLIEDEGIIVNYGLVNQGAKKIYNRLKNKIFRIPVGINIAKTNDSKIKGDKSINDYFKSFETMKDIGNYITINISCPNTGDRKSFENPKLLKKLLEKINTIRKKEIIFLKLSPDITKKDLDRIIKLAERYKINGFIMSNLSKKRENLKLSPDANLKYPGGISGRPVQNYSTEMIKYVYKKTKGKFIIIGVGGIFNGKDAYEKIKNGASLVQLITGLIFEGPGVIKKINEELLELLEKDGYKNIGEAVGKNVN